MTDAAEEVRAPATDGKLNRGALSWAVFEGGRDPFVILITIYIFMPYGPVR